MVCRWLAALVAVVAWQLPATAQRFPARNVTIIVSSTPGALPDLLARAVGQRLQQKWGHSVVIENRAGGAYAIAANALVAAPADGHTLLATESGLYTIQPHLSKARAYDAKRDFLPVSGMARIPMAFFAHPSLEANTISDLIAMAKAKPGGINYGTGGPGTGPHIGMLLLEHMAGVKLTPVHYRGVSLAVNDLLAGHIQLLGIGPSIALPSYRAGKLKILGVGSSEHTPQLGDLPSVAETVPGFRDVSFVLAPGPRPHASRHRRKDQR